MTLIIYAIDLGSTNLKVVLYDENLLGLAAAQSPMSYVRDHDRVEFDPPAVFDAIVALMHRCAAQAALDGSEPALIVVTGQAESLVLVDAQGNPVAKGISWMDERSRVEADEIARHFDPVTAFAITGAPTTTPTWPATKLRWLARHRPEVLAAASRVFMIKDYVLFRLTGLATGEATTRGFTYLYDVQNRTYWAEMLDFCGTTLQTMPELVPAGAAIGPALRDVAEVLPGAASYTVNVGALDHFCAMAGTGSYGAGVVSASAGTVLSLSMLASAWRFDPAMQVSFHPGLRGDDIVLFACADSGGVALSWFRDNIAGFDYGALETELWERNHHEAPLFLPYLTGVNPPDFNEAARGAFVDLQLRHDRVDLAYAVMEGVAHLLRRNLDDLTGHGQRVDGVVSAGGGSASRFWNQLKADACGLDVRVPDEGEAACRGAALLALVGAGIVGSLEDSAQLHPPAEHTYHPRRETWRAVRYDRFDAAIRRLYPADNLHPTEGENR